MKDIIQVENIEEVKALIEVIPEGMLFIIELEWERNNEL